MKTLPRIKVQALVVALAVALPAAASAAVVELEGPAFRLPLPVSVVSGRKKNRVTSLVLPAGSPLVAVRLRSTDSETFELDGATLITGEAATLSADGVPLASVVPEFRVVKLQTNIGAIGGAVFQANGASWFVPLTGSATEGATVVVADSTLNANPLGGVGLPLYDLFPAGATPLAGRILFESYFGDQTGERLTSISVRDMLLFDADSQRGTADSLVKELLVTDFTDLPPGSRLDTLFHGRFDGPVGGGGGEGMARVRFQTGDTANIRALRWFFVQNYGVDVRFTLLDTAALEAAGRTLDDIAQIESYTFNSHTLDWNALGFAP
jgi:hypothetical protein